MPVWMELRCDRRTETKSWRCVSDDNVGPMDMAFDTLADVRVTFRGIEDSARASGWTKTRSGWVCPNCFGRRSEVQGESE